MQLTIIFLYLICGLVSVCHGLDQPLRCLSCNKVANPEDCNDQMQCSPGEVCMTERYITKEGHVFYDLGCKLAQTCSAAGFMVPQSEIQARIKNHLAPPIGKKRQQTLEFDVVHTCEECCDSAHCNNFLCGGHVSANLKCVSCQGYASLSYCDKIDTCQPHEVCYVIETITDTFELVYNSGCMRELQCNAFLDSLKHTGGLLNSPCANCCNNSFCNNYCPVTKLTTPTPTLPSTVCPPFPLPAISTPAKVDNPFVHLGCGSKEDIFFLIDNSKEVPDRDEYVFEIISEALIDTMALGPNRGNVGYSYFSDKLHEVIKLNQGGDHQLINNELQKLETHRNRGTNTSDLAHALGDAYRILSQGRSDAAKTLIVMTENEFTDTSLIATEAARFHQDNITVIVVAVGNFAKQQLTDLESLASDPNNKYLYKEHNMEPLKRILEDIALSKCQVNQVIPTLQPDPCSGPKLLNYLGCGAEEDIVMLLDRSGSITPDDWKQIHEFVHKMVERFNIAPNASRLGVMTFNKIVDEVIPLHEFPNKTKLLEMIDAKLPKLQPDGSTYTSSALVKAMEWFRKSSRSDAIKVVILFTDGGSDTKFATVARALEIHRMNVSVFVIGIGSNVDLREQLILASDPDVEHMINTKDVDGLLLYLKYMEAIRCRDLSLQTKSTFSSTTATTAHVLMPIG